MNHIEQEIHKVQKNPETAKLTLEEIEDSHNAAILTASLEELMNGELTTYDKISKIKEEIKEDELGRIFGVSRKQMATLHNSDNQNLAGAFSSIS